MTRKKVKLAFISNDTARKATFKKRKKGMMKKVSELSTLCGIEACAIVYSHGETHPDIWPDSRAAQRVLAQFKRMPEMEQSKKMLNQESFIRHRIAKVVEQLKKIRRDNRETEMTHLMYQCLTGKGMQGMGFPELNDLGWALEQNLKEVYKRIEEMKNDAVVTATAAASVGDSAVELGVRRTQRWFSELLGNQGGAGKTIMPFNDSISNPASMWSNFSP